MAKNSNNVAVVTSRDGDGLFKVFPVGTVTPLSPADPLPAGGGDVGILSEAGSSLTESTEGGTTITDSDGEVVRVTQGAVTKSITFTIWEVDNPVALGLVYHPDDIVVGDDGKVSAYDDSGRTPPPIKLIKEFQSDTDRIGRRTYHQLTFQSRGDEVTNADGPAGREVTYTLTRVGGYYHQTRLADRVTAPEEGA